jgi:bla regulator protein BlaR1
MSNFLASFVPALANHLWQSTAFAAAAWVLTILLRKNSARVRYGIWLAASIKFLMPFSLLIAMGGLLPRPARSVAPAVYTAMKLTEQPFADVSLASATPAVQTSAVAQRIAADIPAALLVLWIAGVVAVVIVWWARWRKSSICLREAVPALRGRELEILHGLEGRLSSRLRSPLRLRLSSEPTEPCLYGIFRPVLVWPARLSEQLSDEHMEAIMAHELAHARRFDNAAAALHMLVEAVFWFHPLVWWMERRMIEERERACDEAVVGFGASADAYAEGILKTCRFCIGSALPCVAGVTGADLKKRVVGIMTAGMLTRTSWPKKMLLGAAALCVLIAPVLVGQLQTPPSFEVASIRKFVPDNGPRMARRVMGAMDASRFTAVGETAKGLICEAYDLYRYQVSGGPPWVDGDLFNVDAKVDDATAAQLQKLTRHEQTERMDLMLQTLLADRFKLQVMHETKDAPAYALVIAKGGPKLKQASPDETAGGSLRVGDGLFVMNSQAVQIANFARGLSNQLEEPVVDQTGLTGSYDIDLKYTLQAGVSADPSTADGAGDSIFDALQNQLGLKLVSTKAPMETITIVHIEEPTPN